MSPELRAKLEEWLTSDNPNERRHARYRLAMPDPVLTTSLAQEFAPPVTDVRPIAWVAAGCGGCGQKAIEPPAEPGDTA